MAKVTPDERQPDRQQREDVNELLHTEKEHKDWYNPGLMGNLGDKRGHLPKETKKPARKKQK